MKKLDIRVGGKYRLERRLGGGGFGSVYLGINTETGDEVAIKLEHVSIDPSFLEQEVEIYKTLTGVGIPRVHWSGFECEYNVMVFDILGPSLEDLFNFCRRKFSLKTVLMLADQLLYRLDHMHSKKIIHRDIKPDNILMGVGTLGNQVYLTDMGLAIEYSDVRVQIKHKVSDARKLNLIGTARFASINGHLGILQSRRDDMESFGYVLLYFIRGYLPWQGLKKTPGKEKYELILEKKETVTTKDLCDGLPDEFVMYFDYVRSLGFEDKPDYSYLRIMFRNLFVREGFAYDHVYDWTVLKYMMSIQGAEMSEGVDFPSA